MPLDRLPLEERRRRARAIGTNVTGTVTGGVTMTGAGETARRTAPTPDTQSRPVAAQRTGEVRDWRNASSTSGCASCVNPEVARGWQSRGQLAGSPA